MRAYSAVAADQAASVACSRIGRGISSVLVARDSQAHAPPTPSKNKKQKGRQGRGIIQRNIIDQMGAGMDDGDLTAVAVTLARLETVRI